MTRPKMPPGQAATKIISLRLKPSEHDLLQRLVDRENARLREGKHFVETTTTDLLRHLIVQEARILGLLPTDQATAPVPPSPSPPPVPSREQVQAHVEAWQNAHPDHPRAALARLAGVDGRAVSHLLAGESIPAEKLQAIWGVVHAFLPKKPRRS